MDRLEKIINEVKTRQVTMYEGREPRADELLVAEVERLRGELVKYLEEDVYSECIDMRNGWFYIDEITGGELAALRLVELGAWKQHPDNPNWYRPKGGK